MKVNDDPPKKLSVGRRWLQWLKRLVLFPVYCMLFYLLVVLIGLIPVNNDFEPTPDGIEVLLISSSIHCDIVLPIQTEVINWRDHLPAPCFSGDTRTATHVAIGWGNKGFYIDTPTWDDLRFSTVLNALFWPSETCLHVSLETRGSLAEDARSVKISEAQYHRLVDFIQSSFRHNEDGANILIANAAYDTNDAFFEAHGAYHCFNTCNCWAGRALQAASIRVGWFTPLPKTLFLYLPE